MLAIAGCPCVVVYSQDSDPDLCAQRGPKVVILRKESLNALDAGDVWNNLNEIVCF